MACLVSAILWVLTAVVGDKLKPEQGVKGKLTVIERGHATRDHQWPNFGFKVTKLPFHSNETAVVRFICYRRSATRQRIYLTYMV